MYILPHLLYHWFSEIWAYYVCLMLVFFFLLLFVYPTLGLLSLLNLLIDLFYFLIWKLWGHCLFICPPLLPQPQPPITHRLDHLILSYQTTEVLFIFYSHFFLYALVWIVSFSMSKYYLYFLPQCLFCY